MFVFYYGLVSVNSFKIDKYLVNSVNNNAWLKEVNFSKNLHKNFFYIHLGYSFNFFLSFCVTRAYLRLPEVKWVKTGVPGVKPLLGVSAYLVNVFTVNSYI